MRENDRRDDCRIGKESAREVERLRGGEKEKIEHKGSKWK